MHGLPRAAEAGDVDGADAVGSYYDGAAVVVQLVVVPAAQEQAVVDVRRPAVGPMHDVVGLAPRGGNRAMRPAAVSVAGDDRPAGGGGEGAARPPDVDHLRAGAEHHAGHDGV